MTDWIALKEVSKTFGLAGTQFKAIDSINLSIKRGDFITLLGSSGCGKTTSLRLIAGLETPTSGKIFFQGEDITEISARYRDMRMVFQNYALFPNMNVFDNIAFGLRLKRMKGRYDGSGIKRLVNEYIEMVHLGHQEYKWPHQLSGGQQQRVALARALITDPSVVLFDEPLGSLDANLRKAMQVEIKRIHEQLGKTFIYVTHDQEEALAMSDVIAVMKDGKIEQIGPPEQIYFKPKNRFIASFIGTTNLIDGTIESIETNSASVRLANGQIVVVSSTNSMKPGDNVGLVMRADNLEFDMDESICSCQLPGVVTDRLFFGPTIEYRIALHNEVGVIKVHTNSSHKNKVNVGDNVRLGIRSEHVHILED